MKTLVFCAGSPDAYIDALAHYTIDVLVGVDAGANALAARGYTVDYAIGDFDSSEPPKSSLHIVRLPREKDDTDLEAALCHVLAQYSPEHIEQILILGALGSGRLDHLLTNVWLAYQPRFAPYLPKMRWLERHNTMRFFRAGEHVWQRERDKTYVSFIGMTAIESLTLSGLRYPLTQATFAQPMAWVSNECLGDTMQFSFRAGLLCGIQSSDAVSQKSIGGVAA